MSKVCNGYCCLTCINGSCPMALSEEYEEYGIPVVHSCEECSSYEGCKGCDFENTEMCVKSGGGKSGGK